MNWWSAVSFALLSVTLAAGRAIAAKYQFSVPTGDRESRAFSWIPPTCRPVRASLIARQVILEDRVCSLAATATSGLPVRFYVRRGPAQIDGDMLKIDTIPPHAKFPAKVEMWRSNGVARLRRWCRRPIPS